MYLQYYRSKNFSQHYNAIKIDNFEGFSNRIDVDEWVINSMSGFNCKNYKLNTNNYKLNNNLA